MPDALPAGVLRFKDSARDQDLKATRPGTTVCDSTQPARSGHDHADRRLH